MAHTGTEDGDDELPTMSYPVRTRTGELAPEDSDHRAQNDDVHIPVERYRTREQNRLLDKIRVLDTTGCWEWTKYTNEDDYGRFNWGGGTLAHRASYRFFASTDRPELTDDLETLHRCPRDSRTCVNPAHLKPGSHAENQQDMAIAGTHPNRKLSDDDAVEIRERYHEGETVASLADEFDVSKMTVSDCVNGDTFKHVPDVPEDDKRDNTHANQAVTKDEAREILRRSADGETGTSLADEFGVSMGCVSNIINRKSWTDLDITTDEDD